ncbi:MAG: membrane protein insertion efficiency factor YidD [Nitrospirota bacterium]
MKRILISVVELYRYCISPLIPVSCRFSPSCSQYCLDAIDKYGSLKGVYLTLRRLMRCHPLHPGGYDPVK